MKTAFLSFVFAVVSLAPLLSADTEDDVHDLILSGDMKALATYYQHTPLSPREHTNILHGVTSGFLFATLARNDDERPDTDTLYQATKLILQQADYSDDALLAACCNCLVSRNSWALKALLESDNITPKILSSRLLYQENHPTLLGIAFLKNQEAYARQLVEKGATFPQEDIENIPSHRYKWRGLSPQERKVWKELLSL